MNRHDHAAADRDRLRLGHLTKSGTSTPTATPTSASDLAWVTLALQAEYTALDCTKFKPPSWSTTRPSC